MEKLEKRTKNADNLDPMHVFSSDSEAAWTLRLTTV